LTSRIIEAERNLSSSNPIQAFQDQYIEVMIPPLLPNKLYKPTG
jgi:hypothetical protein